MVKYYRHRLIVYGGKSAVHDNFYNLLCTI